MNTINIFKQPTGKINPLFYTFNQNNSGGYFVKDNDVGVSEFMIIEAYSAEDAWIRLQKIGEDVQGFNNYCPCCGERWPDWMDDDEGTKEPELYGEPIKGYKNDFFEKECFIHYLDGKIEHCVFDKDD